MFENVFLTDDERPCNAPPECSEIPRIKAQRCLDAHAILEAAPTAPGFWGREGITPIVRGD